MKNIIVFLILVLSSAGTVAGQFLFKGTVVLGNESHYLLKVGKQRMGLYERVGYYCHFDKGFSKLMANWAALSGGIHLGRYRIWKFMDVDISAGYNWFPGAKQAQPFQYNNPQFPDDKSLA